jgi:hypothetical protein
MVLPITTSHLTSHHYMMIVAKIAQVLSSAVFQPSSLLSTYFESDELQRLPIGLLYVYLDDLSSPCSIVPLNLQVCLSYLLRFTDSMFFWTHFCMRVQSRY